MYKLMVVSGPNRGTTYAIREGRNSIGRQSDNIVVLPSSRVSKHHCSLTLEGDEILLQDDGSSNGTFVNGVLSRSRKVKAGDRISVGEYTLEIAAQAKKLSRPPNAPSAPSSLSALSAMSAGGNVFPFQGPSRPQAVHHFPGPAPAPGIDSGMSGAVEVMNSVPRDPASKALYYFEHYVMPFFYKLNFKHEWRALATVLFAGFALLSVVLSVAPVLRQSREAVVREMARRAQFMARQIADSTSVEPGRKNESRELIAAEKADNVRMAVVVDLENRVILPSHRANQYLVAGAEARIASAAAQAYRKGAETGLYREIGQDGLIAIEPIKNLNPIAGKNVVVGMAIVTVDTGIATLHLGEMGNIFSQAMVLNFIAAAIVLLILYRLTLKPFQVLNEDMDKVLKGDLGQLTHEFKVEELNPLWDLLNSAVQRIPKNQGASSSSEMDQGPTAADYLPSLQSTAQLASHGLLVLDADRKIAHLNPVFEEISGIRPDAAAGQDVSSVARDQSLGVLVSDLCDRARTGAEGVTEDYDFSGISCKVHAVAIGKSGESPRCFAIFVAKNEG